MAARADLKIYFCASIRGGPSDTETCAQLVRHMQAKHGHVFTEHAGCAPLDMDVMSQPRVADEYIFTRDLAWLRQADVVVAEVSTPSLGVGYEVAIAESLRKPVLCLHREKEGRRLSAMIRGNANITTQDYATVEDAFAVVDEFLHSAALQAAGGLGPWAEIAVDALLPTEERELLCFRGTETVKRALNELGTRRFLSAPVCNAAGGCIGLVDKLDMVSFVLSQLREDEGLVFQLNALASDAGRLARASVGDIVNFSGRNAFHPVSRRATLGEVVGMLSRRECARVLVVDEAGLPHGVVTRTTVLRYLAENPAVWQAQARRTVASAVLLRKVVSVQQTSDAFSAFQLMLDRGVSGVAVLDETGALLGDVSPSDLTDLRALRMLLEPVTHFCPGGLPKPVTCEADDTLLEVAQRFASCSARRMYVMDPDGKPVAVVSLSDFMHALLA